MSSTAIAEQHASVHAMPAAWAARLIERMQALYGAKFAQQWAGTQPARLAEIWAEELAGMSGDELVRGLEICRSKPWPPTLPEFIGFCRPSLDPETAFREAVSGVTERASGRMGTWSHPAVYWAAVRVGAHDLLSNGWQVLRNRWENALRDILTQGRWNQIPQPALQLAAPGQTVTTDAEAQRFLAQIRRQVGLGLEPGAAIMDPKAWARRIVASGEVGTIRRRMADAALASEIAE